MQLRLSVLLLVMGLLMLTPMTEQRRVAGRGKRSSIPGAVLVDRGLFPPPIRLTGTASHQCMTNKPSYNCPDTWSAFSDSEGAVCLKLVKTPMTQFQANSSCGVMGGTLVSIHTAARQKTLEGMLKGLEGSVWTGLVKQDGDSDFQWPGNIPMSYKNSESQVFVDDQQDYRYPRYSHKFYDYDYRRGDGSFLCVYLQSLMFTWEATVSCNEMDLMFVCEKSPDCEAGRFGKHCEKECHCHGDSCQGDQPCQYGCQPGWMGPQCCAKKEPADIVHYCVNSAEEGRYVLLRVDPKNVTYDLVTGVDVAMQPLPWCDPVEVSFLQDDGSYTLKLRVSDSNDTASNTGRVCAREKTGDNTYTWRISVQEKRGLRLPLDRTFLITCDFHNAETLSRSHAHSLQEDTGRGKEVTAAPYEIPSETREDVVLEVVDPFTGDVINQAALGSTVALRMRLAVVNELTAQGVSPYDCQASTPGGELSHPLTDRSGCPAKRSPLSKLSGTNGTVSSEPFQLFAFPGYDHVTITCSFQFCFGLSQQSMCNDRCQEQSQLLSLLKRRRRDVDEKPEHVTTKIRILPEMPHTGFDPDAFHAPHHSAAADMMTPVTWLLLAVLLVISGLLIYILFIHSTAQPTRRIP